MTHRIWIWIAATNLIVFALLFMPQSASTHTLVDDEEVKVDLRGAGQATPRLTVDDSGEAGGRFDLNFARLIASGTHKGKGSIFVQVGAKSGVAALLDARLSLDLVDPLSIQMGRFKTPVSAEYLTSATDLLFTRRAALNGLVFKRAAGGQVVVTPLDTGGTSLDLHVGMFSPTSLLAPPGGAVGVFRARFNATEAFGIHASIAEHILAPNRHPLPGPRDRVFPNDRQVDLAFQYDDDVWRGLLEGVYVFDGPADTQPLGLYAQGARMFPVGEYGLEPGLGYDYLDEAGGDLHRATAVFNTYWLGPKLMTSIEYSMEFRDVGPGHLASAALQAAF